MMLYRIVPLLLILPAAVWLYFFLSRSMGVFWHRSVVFRRLVAGVAAVLLALPVRQIFGLYAAVLLHVFAVGIVLDLLFFFLKRRWKRNGRSRAVLTAAYQSGAMTLALTALIFGYAWFNMHRIIRTDYTVYTEKAIREEGYRVAFLSDLHYPTTMNQEKLEKVCRRITEEEPDLVILGGDIVDERSSFTEVEEAFQTLAGIESKFGIFYVYGNHDRGWYSADCDFTDAELATAITESGIHILQDQTEVLTNELTVSGREDRSAAGYRQGGRKLPQELLTGMSDEMFHIVADHQPRNFEEIREAGFDLMLSGHTHGGQMWPVGPITELSDPGTINYGHEEEGTLDVIVSSGIAGWGYAFRTGKHSEYVIVEILPGESS